MLNDPWLKRWRPLIRERAGAGPVLEIGCGHGDDTATLIGQVRDAVREFARHGVDKLVVVNGHYENLWFLIEGIDLGLRDAKAAA